MPAKASGAQDGAFQRELRREAGFHLLGRGRPAGLVIEDGVTAVVEFLDAVDARTQLECALVAERDFQLRRHLGIKLGESGAALLLEIDEPARHALEARPPEGACVGKILQLGKTFFAEPQQLFQRIGGQWRPCSAR